MIDVARDHCTGTWQLTKLFLTKEKERGHGKQVSSLKEVTYVEELL